MNWVLFLFLFVTVSTENIEFSTSSPQDVTVRTKFGDVLGERLPTKKGHMVDYFKGVPFAQKPTRLKKSRLVEKWDEAFIAKTYPSKCLTNVRPAVNATEFSEDCLYLNIVRPSTANENSKLPVVVFIHGGGFQEGFGNDASCEAFAENFVGEGIIVVNIQYRLSLLGFLSLGCEDPRVPCNLGLWDMLTAFQFINTTISDFGGDPSNMTAMGHSAGAMAVSLHSMSPISSRFFQNYIQLSASSWCLTSYKKQNEAQSRKILTDLKCNMTNADTIFECVNSTSLDMLYTVQIDTHLWPEFGDDLLPDLPEKLVQANSKNQKLMTGMMTLESLYFTYLKSSPAIFPFIHRDTVEEYINSSVAIQYGIDSTAAYDSATNYYLASNVSDDDYPYFMKQRTKLDSNIGFDIPILREVRARMKESKDTYLYYFPYFNPAEFDKGFPVQATYHCQEFPYIWGIFKDNSFELNADDHKVSDFLVGALVNFIKTGDPSSSDFTWPQVDSSMTHTVIQPAPTIGKNLFDSDFNFWDSMAQKYNYDLITGLSMEVYETTTGSSHCLSVLIIIILVLLSHNL